MKPELRPFAAAGVICAMVIFSSQSKAQQQFERSTDQRQGQYFRAPDAMASESRRR